MLLTNTLLFLAVAAANSASAASARYPVANKICKSLTIPVTVTSERSSFSRPDKVLTNRDAANYVFETERRDAVIPKATGTKNVTETYQISAKFCTPAKGGPKADIVQVLTHGIGFDKYYWDFPVDSAKYSYVDAAVDAGYSVFFYDRLANGLSTRPLDAISVQAPAELAILHALTKKLRSHKLTLPGAVKPAKLVHVGHSFGSMLSASLAAKYPADSDGLVLTGFAHNVTYLQASLATWAFRSAAENQPARFGDLKGSEYLTWADAWNQQVFFLSAPGDSFDSAILKVNEDKYKQPAALGTFLTIGKLFEVLFQEIKFAKPVVVVTGQYDVPACGGNCDGLLEKSAEYFKEATAKGVFETIMQPGAGHGLNLQYNATGGYKATLKFLDGVGL
ncbi:Alpha/Beta hydrolase protein [Geopyxis carbonaria]|nr:Alpha/Beta hydrolase protein [Geopyxis carbonaria]